MRFCNRNLSNQACLLGENEVAGISDPMAGAKNSRREFLRERSEQLMKSAADSQQLKKEGSFWNSEPRRLRYLTGWVMGRLI